MLITALVLNSIVLSNLNWALLHSSTLGGLHQVVNATCGGGNARVVDDSWQRELFLNPRVSMTEATVLVRAIRRGDVANRQKIPTVGPLAGIVPAMPFIEADQISSISDERLEDGSRAFNVQTGCRSGHEYLIVLVNEVFELRKVRGWIA